MRISPFLLAFLVACVAANNWQPIRIHLHYDSSLDALSSATKSHVQTETRRAADYWQSALKVRRADGPLRVKQSCGYSWKGRCRDTCEAKCDIVSVPASHQMPCVAYPQLPGNTVDTDETKHTINGVVGYTQAKYDAAVSSTPGLEADLVIYITVMDAARDASINKNECKDGEYAANANFCDREDRWNRPTAGRVVLCAQSADHKDLYDLIRHEFVHILIFTDGHFNFFWKDENTAYTKRDADNRMLTDEKDNTPVLKNVTYNDWWTRNGKISHTVTVISTPRVVKEIRAHFGCPRLEGAEVENQGSEGTRGSHWEKRLFRYDVISGQMTQVKTIVTRVTLAFMEDSGWYKADYSKAQEMHWGRGLGCDFAMKSCGEWIHTKRSKGLSPTPFCDRVAAQGCSSKRNTKGVCDLSDQRPVANRGSVPPEFQYFSKIEGVADGDTRFYGGRTQFVDFCPYVKEYGTRQFCNDTTKNTPIQNLNYTYHLQEYGPDSKCIDFDGWKKDGQDFDFFWSETHHGGCYKTECSGGKLNIFVNGHWHSCAFEGEKFTVQVDMHGEKVEGTLVCPGFREVCPYSQSSDSHASVTGFGAFIGFIIFIAVFFGLLLGVVSSPIMY